MKKLFSSAWLSSKQPRKQRKYRYNAPMHRRQKMVAAHLDKSLRKQYKRRAVPIRKGDEVRILRGRYKGKSGSVSKIDLKDMKIYIDNVKRKKPSGQEVDVSIEPSSVKVVKLNLDDKERVKMIRRKSTKEKSVEKPLASKK